MLDWEGMQAAIEGNIFLAGALFAPVLLGLFYLLGLGFGRVEKAHTAWVERENQNAEWGGERCKRQ